ncbi:MAG: hypothetical protein EP298_00550 [Gammaproteobacteria bacterium]|nr:MAG: hypothetical protein EP298_00550 [Gammaproteobacteria bacterium]UTW41891.1 hypothetical protein KFE69_10305 [bacterium SCSIO 12844]
MNYQIITIIFFLFLSSNIVFGSANYTFTIHNVTNFPVSISKGEMDCINDVSEIPDKIEPKKSIKISFSDSNTAFTHCFNNPKYIAFNAIAKYQGKDYNLSFKYYHSSQDDGWHSVIETYNAEPFILTHATCNGIECKNYPSIKQTGDANLSITIDVGNYVKGYELKTLGLGDACLTDGYGNKINQISSSSQRVDLDISKQYIVKFSKTAEKCHIYKGLITCPNNIGFVSKDDNIVFSCQQVSSSDSVCPWIVAKKGVSSHLSNMNIFG